MKRKTIIIISVVLIILIYSWFYVSSIKVDKTNKDIKKEVDKLFTTLCLPEQRNVDACIEIYDPVCASVKVECVTTPCDPVRETFSNSCFACQNERVIGYVVGEC